MAEYLEKRAGIKKSNLNDDDINMHVALILFVASDWEK